METDAARACKRHGWSAPCGRPGAHWRRPRPTLRDRTPRSAGAARYRGSSGSRRNLLLLAANRPFLDAGEVVVGAVSGLPHGEDERQVGLLLALEASGQLLEAS